MNREGIRGRSLQGSAGVMFRRLGELWPPSSSLASSTSGAISSGSCESICGTTKEPILMMNEVMEMNVNRDKNSVDKIELLQMDSLPETMEVTMAPPFSTIGSDGLSTRAESLLSIDNITEEERDIIESVIARAESLGLQSSHDSSQMNSRQDSGLWPSSDNIDLEYQDEQSNKIRRMADLTNEIVQLTESARQGKFVSAQSVEESQSPVFIDHQVEDDDDQKYGYYDYKPTNFDDELILFEHRSKSITSVEARESSSPVGKTEENERIDLENSVNVIGMDRSSAHSATNEQYRDKKPQQWHSSLAFDELTTPEREHIAEVVQKSGVDIDQICTSKNVSFSSEETEGADESITESDHLIVPVFTQQIVEKPESSSTKKTALELDELTTPEREHIFAVTERANKNIVDEQAHVGVNFEDLTTPEREQIFAVISRMNNTTDENYKLPEDEVKTAANLSENAEMLKNVHGDSSSITSSACSSETEGADTSEEIISIQSDYMSSPSVSKIGWELPLVEIEEYAESISDEIILTAYATLRFSEKEEKAILSSKEQISFADNEFERISALDQEEMESISSFEYPDFPFTAHELSIPSASDHEQIDKPMEFNVNEILSIEQKKICSSRERLPLLSELENNKIKIESLESLHPDSVTDSNDKDMDHRFDSPDLLEEQQAILEEEACSAHLWKETYERAAFNVETIKIRLPNHGTEYFSSSDESDIGCSFLPNSRREMAIDLSEEKWTEKGVFIKKAMQIGGTIDKMKSQSFELADNNQDSSFEYSDKEIYREKEFPIVKDTKIGLASNQCLLSSVESEDEYTDGDKVVKNILEASSNDVIFGQFPRKNSEMSTDLSKSEKMEDMIKPTSKTSVEFLNQKSMSIISDGSISVATVIQCDDNPTVTYDKLNLSGLTNAECQQIRQVMERAAAIDDIFPVEITDKYSEHTESMNSVSSSSKTEDADEIDSASQESEMPHFSLEKCAELDSSVDEKKIWIYEETGDILQQEEEEKEIEKEENMEISKEFAAITESHVQDGNAYAQKSLSHVIPKKLSTSTSVQLSSNYELRHKWFNFSKTIERTPSSEEESPSTSTQLTNIDSTARFGEIGRASSVQIVYTDFKLQRNVQPLSIDVPIVNEEELDSADRSLAPSRFSKKEPFEKQRIDVPVLVNSDFLIRINSFAERFFEEISEDVADDLLRMFKKEGKISVEYDSSETDVDLSLSNSVNWNRSIDIDSNLSKIDQISSSRPSSPVPPVETSIESNESDLDIEIGKYGSKSMLNVRQPSLARLLSPLPPVETETVENGRSLQECKEPLVNVSITDQEREFAQTLPINVTSPVHQRMPVIWSIGPNQITTRRSVLSMSCEPMTGPMLDDLSELTQEEREHIQKVLERGRLSASRMELTVPFNDSQTITEPTQTTTLLETSTEKSGKCEKTCEFATQQENDEIATISMNTDMNIEFEHSDDEMVQGRHTADEMMTMILEPNEKLHYYQSISTEIVPSTPIDWEIICAQLPKINIEIDVGASQLQIQPSTEMIRSRPNPFQRTYTTDSSEISFNIGDPSSVFASNEQPIEHPAELADLTIEEQAQIEAVLSKAAFGGAISPENVVDRKKLFDEKSEETEGPDDQEEFSSPTESADSEVDEFEVDSEKSEKVVIVEEKINNNERSIDDSRKFSAIDNSLEYFDEEIIDSTEKNAVFDGAFADSMHASNEAIVQAKIIEFGERPVFSESTRNPSIKMVSPCEENEGVESWEKQRKQWKHGDEEGKQWEKLKSEDKEWTMETVQMDRSANIKTAVEMTTRIPCETISSGFDQLSIVGNGTEKGFRIDADTPADSVLANIASTTTSTASTASTAVVAPSIVTSMFKKATGFRFGGLRSMADGAIKVAGEQLGNVGMSVQKELEKTVSKISSPNFSEFSPTIPSGLDELSEEERNRILTVMAAAKMETEMTGSNDQNEQSKIVMKPREDALELTGDRTPDLSFLTQDEQQQIEAVMNAYDAEVEQEWESGRKLPSPATLPMMMPTLVHEALCDTSGVSTQHLSFPRAPVVFTDSTSSQQISKEDTGFTQPTELPIQKAADRYEQDDESVHDTGPLRMNEMDEEDTYEDEDLIRDGENRQQSEDWYSPSGYTVKQPMWTTDFTDEIVDHDELTPIICESPDVYYQKPKAPSTPSLAIPTIRETPSTPVDPHIDMDEFYVDGRPAMHPNVKEEIPSWKMTTRMPVQYDATEVETRFYEQLDEHERKMREVEAEFNRYTENVLRFGHKENVCPLCTLEFTHCKSCRDCSLSICAHCCGIDNLRKLWMCAMCAVKRELQILGEQLVDRKDLNKNKLDDARLLYGLHLVLQEEGAIELAKVQTHRLMDYNEGEDSEESCPEENEEEYPDEIIEVPSGSAIEQDPDVDVDLDRARQLAQTEVLQQIQQFTLVGESADDEFDVTWAQKMSTKKPSEVDEFENRPSRKNPFLLAVDHDEEDEENEEDEEDEEEGDQDAESATKTAEDGEQVDYDQYYYNLPFCTHRPGSVYTIPEDDEDNVGQEGRIDRKKTDLMREQLDSADDEFVLTTLIDDELPSKLSSTTTIELQQQQQQQQQRQLQLQQEHEQQLQLQLQLQQERQQHHQQQLQQEKQQQQQQQQLQQEHEQQLQQEHEQQLQQEHEQQLQLQLQQEKQQQQLQLQLRKQLQQQEQLVKKEPTSVVDSGQYFVNLQQMSKEPVKSALAPPLAHISSGPATTISDLSHLQRSSMDNRPFVLYKSANEQLFLQGKPSSFSVSLAGDSPGISVGSIQQVEVDIFNFKKEYCR